MSDNPLLANTAAPDFTAIREEHFKPALDHAFARIEATFEKIRDNQDAPNFENAVKPFDSLFAEAEDIFRILYVLVANARTDNLKDIAEEAAKTFDTLSKKIFQNRELGARFKAVYDSSDSLSLDDEDKWFLKNVHWSFEGNGAFLDADQQKELLAIDAALIGKAKEFTDNIDSAQKQQAIHITDPALLAGVPDANIAAFKQQAQEAGKSGWLFIPERLLVDSLLEVAENRDFREQIFKCLERLGTEPPFDNRPVIEAMSGLRDKRSRLLGYDNYAEHHLSATMAGSVDNVMDLFKNSVTHLLPQYEKDIKILESWAAQNGGPAALEPWDVPFYTERYKEETFKFDSNKLAEYLELNNVVKGWLDHASKSFDLTFTATDTLSTWHDDVLTFKVTNNATGDASLLYLDLYARSGEKRGGAWMTELQAPDADHGKLNVIIYNMNLAKPEAGKKTLLSVDQLRTLYHEGGHALHGLTGTGAKYDTRRGTGNGSDYVEIHSMLQENWAVEPDVLATYAFHYKTGDVVPQTLIDTMQASNNFMAARDPLKVIQNALRDLYFHQVPWESYPGADAIQEAADLDSPYSAHIRSYSLTRFDHLFADGLSQYASGYYGYYLSDVNQATAYEAFQAKGLYEPAMLATMREFYKKGAGYESNQAFEAFTGKKSGDPRAFLKGLGIDPDKGQGPQSAPPPPAP